MRCLTQYIIYFSIMNTIEIMKSLCKIYVKSEDRPLSGDGLSLKLNGDGCTYSGGAFQLQRCFMIVCGMLDDGKP